ncbi:MAG: helix-turn-helix transcriptional regulator [Bryobacteraceae bacterium]
MLPVEVIDRSELIRRLGRALLASPERPEFESFLLVRSGTGLHTVDFTETPLKPGRVVRVRPGQVQIWDTQSIFEATLVLARYTTPRVGMTDVWQETCRDLDRGSQAAKEIEDVLRREQRRFAGDGVTIALMQSLFDALSCLFHRAAGASSRHMPKSCVAFLEAVEANFSWGHTVRQLAAGLGYSERTITRACLKVSGRSAREVLNRRVLLEAKRMLAHTHRPASEIGKELGFSEATNFHQFFKRHAGVRPGDFRALSDASGNTRR